MSKRSLALLLTAIGALAFVVQASASDDDGGRPSRGFAGIESIEERAVAALSVLSVPRRATDALPADLARRMGADAPFGMNPALSRRALGNATHSVFVLPARDHVCVSLTVGEGANLSCPTTDDVTAGLAGPATVGLDRGVAVYGLVPNGVESVSVDTGVGQTRVETSSNAYYTVVPDGTPLRHLRYAGPSGPVEFRIHDPAGAFEE